MTITFNRAQLIKVANAALTEHAKAQKSHAAVVEQYKARHAAAKTQATRDRAIALRDGLTRALRKAGPISSRTVRASIPGVYRIDDMFYTAPSDHEIRNNVTAPKGLLTPAEVSETGALISVLGAATGDTITANELKLLGLKNLQPVFVAAANSTVPK